MKSYIFTPVQQAKNLQDICTNLNFNILSTMRTIKGPQICVQTLNTTAAAYKYT